jgi:hypothetical protein
VITTNDYNNLTDQLKESAEAYIKNLMGQIQVRWN